MVTRILLAALLCTASGCAVGEDRCTKGSDFEPPLCAMHLPKISKISIVENAAKSPIEKDATIDCGGFTLSEAQVRRYLSFAKSANESDAHHTLDWSPCYASGKVIFADGTRGTWTISESRTGSLAMDGGKDIFLYCPTCTFKPFWQ